MHTAQVAESAGSPEASVLEGGPCGEVVLCEYADVEEIKEMNRQIFPVVYYQDFYNELFGENARTCLVRERGAGKSVGLFSVRFTKPSMWGWSEPSKTEQERGCASCLERGDVTEEEVKHKFVYVVLLGLLESERRKGFGRMMVESIEKIAEETGMDHILLHVQVSNLSAIEFYYKLGFKLVKHVKDYYVNIHPRDAFLLRKCLYTRPS
ncbi:N-alpha-acetyltransferase 50 [Nematocida sp. AWRm77]|nr:N-alpha-acetyltransferase 50 [Nematocida sp. AWRm77]